MKSGLKKFSAEAETTIKAIFKQLDERGLFQSIDKRCKAMFVKVEDIIGKSRTKAVVRARHEVWLWMHDELGLSWPEVAHIFGREHASVIHARLKRSKASKAEDDVAEKIATWLSREYPSNVDTPLMVNAICEGDWRRVTKRTDIS